MKKRICMKLISVTKNEAGQRADKLLAKYLDEAPKSFLYKMMRKKNITLNGKKMQGNEMLQVGDEVKLFLADETVEKFQKSRNEMARSRKRLHKETEERSCKYDRNSAGQINRTGKTPLDIIYEDEHILLLNKPSGMLSQKARPEDVSAVEYLIDHLLKSGSLTEEQLKSFHPSVCNRLDRNTSGLLLAGKSLPGLQEMSRLLKERTVHKYYCCVVKGEMTGERHLRGYLSKDSGTNRVFISEQPLGDARPIETKYRCLGTENGRTLLEVLLITGRSHQIRAHLSSIGHPIAGDPKYGDENMNRRLRQEYGIRAQLLHAWRLEFPEMEGEFAYLSGKVFEAPLPEIYGTLVEAETFTRI